MSSSNETITPMNWRERLNNVAERCRNICNSEGMMYSKSTRDAACERAAQANVEIDALEKRYRGEGWTPGFEQETRNKFTSLKDNCNSSSTKTALFVLLFALIAYILYSIFF